MARTRKAFDAWLASMPDGRRFGRYDFTNNGIPWCPLGQWFNGPPPDNFRAKWARDFIVAIDEDNYRSQLITAARALKLLRSIP